MKPQGLTPLCCLELCAELLLWSLGLCSLEAICVLHPCVTPLCCKQRPLAGPDQTIYAMLEAQINQDVLANRNAARLMMSFDHIIESLSCYAASCFDPEEGGITASSRHVTMPARALVTSRSSGGYWICLSTFFHGKQPNASFPNLDSSPPLSHTLIPY